MEKIIYCTTIEVYTTAWDEDKCPYEKSVTAFEDLFLSKKDAIRYAQKKSAKYVESLARVFACTITQNGVQERKQVYRKYCKH